MAKFFNLATKTKVAAQFSKKKGDICPFIPGTAGDATSIVELSVSCKNLPNKDVLSKSDPMVVIFHRPPGSRKWVPLMRTEVIYDELDPEFCKKLVIEYRFEQIQSLRFEVYDIDTKNPDLEKQELIGFLDCTLGQVVNSRADGMTLELNTVKYSVNPTDTSKAPATITLIAEEIGTERDEVMLKLCGISCGVWKFIIPPRTYFQIYKNNEAGHYVVVYRSNCVFGSNPSWAPMRLSCRTLCNNDYDRELRIDVYQKQLNFGRSVVGSVLTTLNKLLKTGQEKIQLMGPTGQTGKAHIRIQSCIVETIPTFLDYMQSGMHIQTIFAIDFTCSNGDPSDLQSLHYISPGSQHPNPYEQAITAVGAILKDYDSTGEVQAYGFGARIPPKGELSYDFPLTLSKNADCCSIPGVIEQYRQCLDKCQLYGPTYFEKVIKLTARQAAKSRFGEVYYILVIITDGVITDLQKTKKAIVEASTLPMSIIVIGVGEADFDVMEELDGDAVRLRYRRKLAARDIVQFVAYRSARVWLSNTGESTTANMYIPNDDYMDAIASTGAVGEGAVDKPPGEAGTAEEGESTEAKKPEEKAPSPPTPAEEDDPLIIVPNLAATTQPEPPESNQDKTHRLAGSRLAAEVLAEIPDQIISFMKLKGILPQHIAELHKAVAEIKRAKVGEKPAEQEEAVPQE